MLIAMLLFTSGTLIGIRISRQLLEQSIFSENLMTKIGTVYAFSVFFGALFLTNSFQGLWILIFAPQIFFLICAIYLRKMREKSFRKYFRESLTNLILKMKTGKSLRQALHEIANESDPFMRRKLSEITEIVVFSQQKSRPTDSFVAQVIRELCRADQNAHSSMRILTTYRDRLRVEDEFRHKSGQVLSQIRFQALLMSGLYFAVLVFVSFQFGFHRNQKLIGVSLFFFILGLAWIFFGGRRLKWKV